MKVISKNNFITYGHRLTKDKEYEVISERKETYKVRDDYGKEYGFYKWRFEDLNCDNCVERKCNSCKLSRRNNERIKK